MQSKIFHEKTHYRYPVIKEKLDTHLMHSLLDMYKKNRKSYMHKVLSNYLKIKHFESSKTPFRVDMFNLSWYFIS